MKTFTPGHFVTTSAMQCNFSNENDNEFEFIADEDEKMNEIENESEKPNTPKEKNAIVMQKIWGDNFQTDSLH